MHRYAKALIWLTVILFLSGLLIAFETAETDSKVCKNVLVTIDNQFENYFVNEEDIMQFITANGTEMIVGTAYKKLNLREIEKRLFDEPFLSKSDIYVDHSGNLIVHVALRKPIARIVRYNGPDAFISEDGQLLPVYDKYSKRTILITGYKSKELVEQINISTGDYAPLYELINKINSDKFLHAQIAQIKLLKNNEIILYPQVTKQYIEFGKIKDIDVKFKKLKLFYDEILPRKGWNSYSKVSLKYKNQIICE